MSAHRVMKFGGTSLGSPDRLRQVADIVAAAEGTGPLVVVVSAMEHTTDRLLEAAERASSGDLDAARDVVCGIRDLTRGNAASLGVAGTAEVDDLFEELDQLLHGTSLLRECSPQSLDLVLSIGERISSRVVASLLRERGVDAVAIDAREIVVTRAEFGLASVREGATRARLRDRLADWQDRVPVVTGFLGRTEDGRTTTLGRNGSDYTATLLANILGASEVTLWTDVSGVMTADPAIVPDGFPLAHLSYREALELADFGASMFHARTMIPLMDAGIPMRIRNTTQPEDPGTLVDAAGSPDATSATSVTSLEDLAIVSIRIRRLARQARVGARVLAALDAAEIPVFLATQAAHGQAVAVVIRAALVERAEEAVNEELALPRSRGDVEPASVRQPVSLLTLVAEAMAERTDVAWRLFHALGAVGIDVLGIGQGASSRSVSCVIPGAQTPAAVRSVHSAFHFAHQDVSLAVLGVGTVGRALLEQIREQHDTLLRDHEVRLRVVGLSRSERAAFDEDGLDLTNPARALESGEPVADAVAMLDRLRGMPVPILVDGTAADGLQDLYREAFRRGIHVVAANKKALTVAWSEREALFADVRRHRRRFQYETTVGAGLPVLETLANLVRTGDRVRRIEGCLSGTLGYLANALTAGETLSAATRRARELGYSEPLPYDDLAGTDVARKALILAREIGLPLSFEDVEVEPLVPLESLAGLEGEAFFAALEALDDSVAERVAALREEGRVLRYLARIAPDESPIVTVGPMGVPADHPAAWLHGTEAFVAYTTERYAEHPLIIRGGGAGGDVTAAGVLADVLGIARAIRGPRGVGNGVSRPRAT